MVNHSAAALDATFGALADPTRRAILARLAETPGASVGEIASPFAMSAPAISRHLRVLEDAGLLARRREGRVHHCRFRPGPMRTAADWIAHYEAFWQERLDALRRCLETAAPECGKQEDDPWPSRRPTRPRLPRGSASRGRSKRRATASTGPGRTRSS